MKKTTNILVAALIVLPGVLAITGCEENVELPDQDESQYNQLYMPLAVNDPVEMALTVSEEEQVIIYGANYGGRGYPEEDIPVNFEVDPARVTAFNDANGTTYELLPAGSYALSATETFIPRGGLSTAPLSLTVETSGPDAPAMFTTYLLPLTIRSSFRINEDLQTTYYLVTVEPDIADYPDFDTSQWQIIDFSSEEANGEGPDNGRAIFALDGDIQTFWHSQWQGASPGPPHHITIDMGEVKTLHGINATARQVDGSGGKPDLVKIETSMDNVTWQDAGQFNLAPIRDPQKVWLPVFEEARYFKFIVLSSYSSSSVHLAEVGAY